VVGCLLVTLTVYSAAHPVSMPGCQGDVKNMSGALRAYAARALPCERRYDGTSPPHSAVTPTKPHQAGPAPPRPAPPPPIRLRGPVRCVRQLRGPTAKDRAGPGSGCHTQPPARSGPAQPAPKGRHSHAQYNRTGITTNCTRVMPLSPQSIGSHTVGLSGPWNVTDQWVPPVPPPSLSALWILSVKST